MCCSAVGTRAPATCAATSWHASGYGRHRPTCGSRAASRCARSRSKPAPSASELAGASAREPFALVLTLRPDGACPSDLALRFGVPAKRADLPCDGLLSPAHWREGDLIRSKHPLSDRELTEIERYGLWLGVARS